MRVAINLDPSDTPRSTTTGAIDFGEDPGAVEGIEAAKEHAALRSLLVNLNTVDSPVWSCGCETWSTKQEGGGEPWIFASHVDLIFHREDNNLQTTPHENLAQRLVSLLGREKADALRAELQICGAELRGRTHGYCLRICLYARGVTPEQAQMRWGLGIARLQQALLFTARELRREPGMIE